MAVIAIEPEVEAPFLKLTSLMSQICNTKGPICLIYVLKLLINVIRAIGCTLRTLCVLVHRWEITGIINYLLLRELLPDLLECQMHVWTNRLQLLFEWF